jgi:hypothetical protein
MRADVIETITLARLRCYHFLAIPQAGEPVHFLRPAAPGAQAGPLIPELSFHPKLLPVDNLAVPRQNTDLLDNAKHF